jgi:hypothetical protein
VAYKNSDVRLTEAMNFFRNTPVGALTPQFRNELYIALWNWKNATPVPVQTQLSNLMSQTNAAHRPATAGDRQYRRTSILLKCAIGDPTPGHWAALAAAVNVRSTTYAINYATAVSQAIDAYYSRPAVVALLIQALKTDPGTFLLRYKLSVGGQGASGVENYAVEMFQQRLRMLIPHAPPKAMTPALKVGVTSWLRVVNGAGPLHPIVGTDTAAHAGQDLLVTTQFTGCTFCYMKNPAGTEVVAAHIDPGAGLAGERLPHLHGRAPRPGVIYSASGEVVSAALRAGGAFHNGNGGVFRAHGRWVAAPTPADGYGNDATVIILGVKRGGVWEMWRQLQTAGGMTAIRIDQ